MDLTSWEAASDLIHEWNTTGRIGGRLHKTASMPEAVTAYLEYCGARKLSPRSVARYRAFLERVLLPWCEAQGVASVRDFTFDRATRFYASWTTWSSYTVAKNLELLRMFLRYCVRARWTEENAAADLKGPRITMAPTLPFSEAEEAMILAACDQYHSHPRWGRTSPERLRTFVLTLRYSGLRIGDVATLATSRLLGNRLQLYTHKTGVMVIVPLPPFVANALRIQASRNANPDYFFWTGRSSVKCVTASWQRALKNLCRKAGVPDGHAHRYRDTFAVSLLLAGVPIADVATLLGHTSTAVTEKHYAPWVAARQERLENLLAQTWKPPTLRLVQTQ